MSFCVDKAMHVRNVFAQKTFAWKNTCKAQQTLEFVFASLINVASAELTSAKEESHANRPLHQPTAIGAG